MKHFSHPFALLTAALVASGLATQPIVAQEQAQETIHWGDPDRGYISTAWPMAEGSDLVDIREMPKLERGFFLTAPQDRNDGIVVGELGVDGGNNEMIVNLAQEISGGQHGDLHSLLIAHKGKLLFESYFLRGRINLSHPQASTTKAYTSLALGRAIQLGYLTMADLNKPVISFLNELDRSDFVEGAEKVTLHQALTMRSGIRIIDEKGEEFERYRDLIDGQKLVQAIFERSDPITDETQAPFSYGNYSTPLVMQVIEAVVPGGAEHFIQTELLGKLGITDYEWRTDLGGLPAAGWKTSFTSRHMMKFGMLTMNKGQWNGEQLIPEAYINRATSRLLQTGDDDVFGGGEDVSNQGYGYFWWAGDLQVGDRTYYATSAQGGGGQFIIVIDELDLTIVITAAMREPKSLQLVAERILPAFIQ